MKYFLAPTYRVLPNFDEIREQEEELSKHEKESNNSEHRSTWGYIFHHEIFESQSVIIYKQGNFEIKQEILNI